MKRTIICFVVLGAVFFTFYQTFVKADPTDNRTGDASVNQADGNNPGAADMPSDTQSNSVNVSSDSGNNQ